MRKWIFFFFFDSNEKMDLDTKKYGRNMGEKRPNRVI